MAPLHRHFGLVQPLSLRMTEFGSTRSMNMFFSRIISPPLSDRTP
jgi:hypothetical protein